MNPNDSWRRTFKVDATAPLKLETMPLDDSYEAASFDQEVRVLINDEVGSPMTLNLNYWVEADHDLNRNGLADSDEYVITQVENLSDEPNKWFTSSIDH